ncbi:hypothetical protein MKW94_009491 [Papaver nudicaule]|uniref:Protein TIFY n=1 Tax=Papaver nudicaule TaxID=74823 RepID=A0AA41VB18_PAPNU|nr:hypothetical protein [Papaver nudicaule]
MASSSSAAQEVLKSKNFSNTCNLLSQYLKENKGAAMNLASAAAASPMVTSSSVPNREVKSMDLFPQHAGVSLTPNTVEIENTSESAQMTIFYGGKIVVLDNLAADKAKQVLGFAKNISIESNNVVAPTNDLIRKDLMPPPRPQQQQKQQPIVSGFSSLYKTAVDVPAAKNSSLQRFLAKRKERISARAPYQVMASSSSSTPEDSQAQANNIDESKTWLGL